MQYAIIILLMYNTVRSFEASRMSQMYSNYLTHIY